MFCSNCGKEIADVAKFCKYCGFSMDESADIKNEVSSVSHTEIATEHNTEMNRGALLLYLQNVRDLEVARYVLNEKHGEKQVEYNRNYNYYYREPDLKQYPYEPMMEKCGKWKIGIVCAVVLGIFNLVVRLWVLAILAFAFVIYGIIHIVMAEKSNYERQFKYEYQYKVTHRQNEKAIADAKDRQRQGSVITANWNAECEEYEKNIEEIGNILTLFYDMNIIAKEYRGNLAALQYIYEVAESTQLPYEQICLQMKMEDGIRRVESKLNEIVNKVEDLIFETRCVQMQQNEIVNSLIEKNNKMLKTLQQTEQNSALTAQYAQLASNYAEANAYFSLATYLKN